MRSSNVIVLLLCVGAAIGCASSSSDTPSHTNGNGVNDVKLACEARNAWTAPTSSTCLSCLSLVSIALCDCQEDNPLASRCNAQALAKRDQPDCSTELNDCVSACGSDCTCADACFNSHAACKSASAALEGCVVEVCADSCK